MGAYKSQKYIPVQCTNLEPVADDVLRHFQSQGFDASGEPTLSEGWDVSIRKGGVFKSVLGLKTALKISIEPSGAGTLVQAGVGIWGQQAIPTVISMFVFWPVLITQLWGFVVQSNLDDEAILQVENSLLRRAAQSSSRSAQTGAAGTNRFCTQCGAGMNDSAKFCHECGAKL